MQNSAGPQFQQDMKYYTGSCQLNGMSTIPEGQLLVIYLEAGYQLGGLFKLPTVSSRANVTIHQLVRL